MKNRNKMKKVLLCLMFIVPLISHVKSQVCYTVQRDIKSYDEWYLLVDTLFKEAVMDSTKNANALLILKMDSLGFALSAHISDSQNFNSKFFHRICSKIEDCYSYSFLIEQYYSLDPLYKKLIAKKYMYLQYVYRYRP